MRLLYRSVNTLSVLALLLFVFLPGCGGKFTAPPLPGSTDNFLLEADAIYWPADKTTLTYAIEETTSSIPGADMAGEVDAGVRDWLSATRPDERGGITLTKGPIEMADIVIRFGTRDQTQGDYGNTRYDYADVHKTIIKRAYTYIYRGLFWKLMRPTAAHEFAHALGWRSHVRDRNSIMSQSGIELWSRITEKDGNTVYLLTHPEARNGQ